MNFLSAKMKVGIGDGNSGGRRNNSNTQLQA